MLYLLRQSLRRRGVIRRRVARVDVSVSIPHAPKQQPELFVAEGEGARWYFFVRRRLPEHIQATGPFENAVRRLSVDAAGIDGRRPFVRGARAADVCKCFCGRDEVRDGCLVLVVVVHATGMPQIPFGEQVTECNHLMSCPRGPRSGRQCAWHGDVLTHRNRLEITPPIDQQQRVIARGDNLPARLRAQAEHRLDAIVHDIHDAPVIEAKRVDVTRRNAAQHVSLLVQIGETHQTTGQRIINFCLTDQTLIESVTSERFDLTGKLIDDLRIVALRDRLRHELAKFLLDQLRVFLADGLSQHVRFGQRDARQHLRQTHHLFLIRDDAVGVRKNRLQLGQRVHRGLFAPLAPDVYVVHARIERTRAQQGV